MLDLGSKDNKVLIHDSISETEIELTYRTPTTTEIQEYYSSAVNRQGGKTKSNVVAARVILAKRILTGIRDGDFGIDGSPISSSPESPAYYPEWKQLLEDKAPLLLDVFIREKIEGTYGIKQQLEQMIMGDDDELPLAKS
jgi:hypothetical protein